MYLRLQLKEYVYIFSMRGIKGELSEMQIKLKENARRLYLLLIQQWLLFFIEKVTIHVFKKSRTVVAMVTFL